MTPTTRTTHRNDHEQLLTEITHRLTRCRIEATTHCGTHLVEDLNGVLQTINHAKKGDRHVNRTAATSTRETHRRHVDALIERIDALAAEVQFEVLNHDRDPDVDDALSIIAAIIRQAPKIGYR